VLADLTSATGARPVVLRADPRRTPENAAITLVISLPEAAPDLIARVERRLTRFGAKVEILGHVQPAS
jgi:hypothetical protein